MTPVGRRRVVMAFTRASEPVHTSTDPVDLLAYSHDVFPLALKAAGAGLAAARPDVIAYPHTPEEVQRVVRAARRSRLAIVPYGGGSGIVGGALPVRGGVVIETKALAGLIELDAVSGLATFGAGTNGQRLEDTLNELGFTSGHYPQSLRSSTLGGWIAHRATGTASTRYGGIEQLLAGLEVVLPSGDLLTLPAQPRTATGIDLRQLFLGAEGTMGIVVAATLRVSELPEARRWTVVSIPSFADGLAVVRLIVRSGLRPAVVRVYDALESADRFAPAGIDGGRSVLLLSSEGDRQLVTWQARRFEQIARAAGGRIEPPVLAELWWASRFDTPALLRTLGEPTGIADALEVAAPWSRLAGVYDAMRDALTSSLDRGTGSTAVYGHSSHAYPDGANLYMIFHGHAPTESEVGDVYWRAVGAALQACASSGGTISHHHGIGLGKARWLELEYGGAGLSVLRAVQAAVDPRRQFNPGKLGDAADA
jgi:alkyldihydroxyacetonephosphate synthase